MPPANSRLRTVATALGIALTTGALAALAAITPYDFSGHWAGSSTDTKTAQTATVTADFAPGTAPNSFTGPVSIQVPQGVLQCTALGKLKAHLKVKIRLTQCGHVIRLHGTVDPTTQTVTGKFVRVGGHRSQHGTFTLTRAA